MLHFFAFSFLGSKIIPFYSFSSLFCVFAILHTFDVYSIFFYKYLIFRYAWIFIECKHFTKLPWLLSFRLFLIHMRNFDECLHFLVEYFKITLKFILFEINFSSRIITKNLIQHNLNKRSKFNQKYWLERPEDAICCVSWIKIPANIIFFSQR